MFVVISSGADRSPQRLAEDWDAVGLSGRPSASPVRRVLTCLDDPATLAGR
jgi:putative NIF3 family GTP cyclohydrolase 1 type 2